MALPTTITQQIPPPHVQSCLWLIYSRAWCSLMSSSHQSEYSTLTCAVDALQGPRLTPPTDTVPALTMQARLCSASVLCTSILPREPKHSTLHIQPSLQTLRPPGWMLARTLRMCGLRSGRIWLACGLKVSLSSGFGIASTRRLMGPVIMLGSFGFRSRRQHSSRAAIRRVEETAIRIFVPVRRSTRK